MGVKICTVPPSTPEPLNYFLPGEGWVTFNGLAEILQPLHANESKISFAHVLAQAKTLLKLPAYPL